MHPFFPVSALISAAVALYTPFFLEGIRALQQTQSLVIGAIIGAATLAFILLIIAVLWLLGRVSQLEAEEPTRPVLSAGRPTLVGLETYANLFVGLEAGLNREEAINMAFTLGIDTSEWGDAAPKSKIIRDTIIHMENRNRVGHIYKWISQHRPEMII